MTSIRIKFVAIMKQNREIIGDTCLSFHNSAKSAFFRKNLQSGGIGNYQLHYS